MLPNTIKYAATLILKSVSKINYYENRIPYLLTYD